MYRNYINTSLYNECYGSIFGGKEVRVTLGKPYQFFINNTNNNNKKVAKPARYCTDAVLINNFRKTFSKEIIKKSDECFINYIENIMNPNANAKKSKKKSNNNNNKNDNNNTTNNNNGYDFEYEKKNMNFGKKKKKKR